MTKQSTPRQTPEASSRRDDPPMIPARTVEGLQRDHPRLHVWGVGPHPALTLEPAAYAELMTPYCRVRMAAALAWVEANLVPAPRGNRKHARSTYSLKHQMERETGLYVPNGVFAAAVLLSHLSADTSYYSPLVFATLNPDVAQRTGGSDSGPADNPRR